MSTVTVEEFLEAHPDNRWRKKLYHLNCLIRMLADCIIADDYTISDQLNQAIHLTAEGKAVMNHLVRKCDVPVKEARLMCALIIGHDTLFLDVDRTSVEDLANAIAGEASNGRIRFPLTLGRDLYDGYASLFEEEKVDLNVRETQRLLNAVPRGVFQYGEFTSGDYGVRRAPTNRHMPFRRNVPAYHCEDKTCQALHSTLLETSQAARINADQNKLADYLQGLESEPANWWALALESGGISAAYYKDQESATLFPILGDCLDLRELRSLLSHVLDNTKGTLRGSLSWVGPIGRAEDFADSKTREQILQLLLFIPDATIAASLDALIKSSKIVVPVGEVRRPITSRRSRSGAFGLLSEIGANGVRYVSNDPGFPLLRERRLLNKLYDTARTEDALELGWQLRGFDAPDLSEKLEDFYRDTPPRQVLERLVLTRRSNMIIACEEVGLEDPDSLGDPELLDAILWKLGFPVSPANDPHLRFWMRHEKLWALTQPSSRGGHERFQEAAGPFFTELEGILTDSLAFTSWALLVDHVEESMPFSYDDSRDASAGLSALQSHIRGMVAEPSTDYSSDRLELRPLILGFGALSRALTHARGKSSDHLRPAKDIPKYDGRTELKHFAMKSRLPYLNLSQTSQERIGAGLREISDLFETADVASVRNDYSHYRKTPPEVPRIEAALRATRDAVERIETLGFCRMLFSRTATISDEWGSTRHEFVGPRSYDHTFVRPTRLDWMGLPPLREPQFLLRSAYFDEPSEVLRFRPRHSSAFASMWSNFPNRRRRATGTSSQGATASPEAPEAPQNDE